MRSKKCGGIRKEKGGGLKCGECWKSGLLSGDFQRIEGVVERGGVPHEEALNTHCWFGAGSRMIRQVRQINRGRNAECQKCQVPWDTWITQTLCLIIFTFFIVALRSKTTKIIWQQSTCFSLQTGRTGWTRLNFVFMRFTVCCRIYFKMMEDTHCLTFKAPKLYSTVFGSVLQ